MSQLEILKRLDAALSAVAEGYIQRIKCEFVEGCMEDPEAYLMLRVDGKLSEVFVPICRTHSVSFTKMAKEVEEMSLVKHGTGEILPEKDDNTKTASENWSKEDDEELQKELNEEGK
jgi:hypothetical protein